VLTAYAAALAGVLIPAGTLGNRLGGRTHIPAVLPRV
jgi:hypothetical protein